MLNWTERIIRMRKEVPGDRLGRLQGDRNAAIRPS